MKKFLMVFLATAAAAVLLFSGCRKNTDYKDIAVRVKKLSSALYSEFLYSKGELYIEQDFDRRALDCYFRAAALGHAKSLYILSMFYEQGDRLKLCGKEAARLRAEAIPGLERRAMRGDPEAQLMLSICYSEDNKNLRMAEHLERTAFRKFKRQAEAGNAYACVMVGRLYEMPSFQKKSPEKAIEWYRKAAEQGFWYGITQMARCCLRGVGMKKDINEMFLWCRKAALSGHVGALAALGASYETGIGANEDREKAFECYRAAAEQGHPAAMFFLGKYYENGIGVDENREKAIFWYRRALAEGYEDAGKHLSDLTGNRRAEL